MKPFKKKAKCDYSSAVHKALEKKVLRDAEEEYKKQLFAEVNMQAENFLSDDVFTGQKALMLLALKKEGWGKQRALRLLQELEDLEKAFIVNPDGPDNSIDWDSVFAQVKEEYGIEFVAREG